MEGAVVKRSMAAGKPRDSLTGYDHLLTGEQPGVSGCLHGHAVACCLSAGRLLAVLSCPLSCSLTGTEGKQAGLLCSKSRPADAICLC